MCTFLPEKCQSTTACILLSPHQKWWPHVWVPNAQPLDPHAQPLAYEVKGLCLLPHDSPSRLPHHGHLQGGIDLLVLHHCMHFVAACCDVWWNMVYTPWTVNNDKMSKHATLNMKGKLETARNQERNDKEKNDLPLSTVFTPSPSLAAKK